MQLFVEVLRLLDSLIRAMLLNDFLGSLLGLCVMAVFAGVALKLRQAAIS